ncbi:MAG: hypothetical protein ACKOQM_02495 [Novosphingobium sp.]
MKRLLSAFLFAIIPTAVGAGVFYNNSPQREGQERERMEGAWLVRVKAGQKAFFYATGYPENCPSLTVGCKRRGYVIGGDLMVASYTTGPFTVVDFIGPKGIPIDGAIETRQLETVPAPLPALPAWQGLWQYGGEQQIRISRSVSAGVLYFQGDATWGAGDPDRVKRGGVHIGSFAAFVKPSGQWGGFIDQAGGASDPGAKMPRKVSQNGLQLDWAHAFPYQADDGYNCQVRFRLLGPYLLAYDDHNQCGGVNVTFTGIYRQIH